VPYSPPTSGGGGHTGAIAGGVAGGVVAVVVAIVLLIFCWRRNRRPEEPGAIFYPERVVRQTDIHTDLEGAEVTPFSYTPTTGTFSGGAASPTFSGDGSMQQYRDSQALLGGGGAGAATTTGTSGSHYAPTSSGDGSAPLVSASHARSSSLGSAGLGPGFPVPQPHRGPLSPKEGGLGLATALDEGEGIVVQHSDGGRVADSEPIVPNRLVQEIPPSYDSIPGNP
jgi:hypothetical protein